MFPGDPRGKAVEILQSESTDQLNTINRVMPQTQSKKREIVHSDSQ